MNNAAHRHVHRRIILADNNHYFASMAMVAALAFALSALLVWGLIEDIAMTPCPTSVRTGGLHE